MNEMVEWELIQPYYMSPIFSSDDQTSEKLNPYHFQIYVIAPYILKSVSRIAVRDFEKTLNILMCCII